MAIVLLPGDNKGKTKQIKNVDTKSKQKNEVFTEDNGNGSNRNEKIIIAVIVVIFLLVAGITAYLLCREFNVFGLGGESYKEDVQYHEHIDSHTDTDVQEDTSSVIHDMTDDPVNDATSTDSTADDMFVPVEDNSETGDLQDSDVIYH